MMNPGGAVEEVGKAANTFMDTMKSQPLSLALVVMNFALLGLIYFIAESASQSRKREVEGIYTNQKEIMALIARCGAGPRLQSDESRPVELPPIRPTPKE